MPNLMCHRHQELAISRVKYVISHFRYLTYLTCSLKRFRPISISSGNLIYLVRFLSLILMFQFSVEKDFIVGL